MRLHRLHMLKLMQLCLRRLILQSLNLIIQLLQELLDQLLYGETVMFFKAAVWSLDL
jgi:hypothetical protein